MRLAVIDVGSNTVHLLIVDARRGGHPWPAHSEKVALRLAEQIGPDGALTRAGADALVKTVAAFRDAAAWHSAGEVLAFATSAVRDATDAGAVLTRVREETGVPLEVLSGADEARATFLAVRRWCGWSAGRLLTMDIGGGSLELAAGFDEVPGVALSLPLGAGRLTRERLGVTPDSSEPVPAQTVEELRAYVREQLDPVLGQFTAGGWDRAVATSKTFRMLARLAGAAPAKAGLWTPRALTRRGVRQVLGFIRHIAPAKLRELEGVSASRAHQLLAGALVAETLLHRLEIDSVDICPWALREGLILRRLDQLADDGA